MNEAANANPTYDSYIEVAAAIVDSLRKERFGFDALRHYGSILDETVRLAFDSSFFRPPAANSWPAPWPFDPEFFHFVFRGPWPRPRPAWFLQNLLASPQHFDPEALWALFWGLAKAEHEFVRRYVPFWSHEERLTGHLVSQMIERIEGFADHWNSLSRDGKEASCRVWYADTATARQESSSGADLGLIVHAKFGEQREFWKTARLQAKKAYANGKATIRLDQLETLSRSERSGYFLFYHEHRGMSGWTLPPTVRAAAGDVANRIPKDAEQGRRPKDTFELDACSDGWDLATFVAFALADPTSDHGAASEEPGAAVRHLFLPNMGAPSRVMIVTLGSGTRLVDWPELMRELMG